MRVYASSTATTQPGEWAAKNACTVGAFPEWHKPSPTMVEQFWRETEANGGLDLSQVPRDGNTTVAWYWQCDRGHRWRETTYSRLDFPLRYRRPPSRNMPRWKNFGGTRAACRQCVLEDYGATYEKCGHIDPDLNHVDKPRQVYDGWCRSCGSNAGPQLGEAFHADHAPSTSGAEETLRALLRVRLPIATSQEANAVRVRPTAWGALHVFPDLLIPSSRVAIEYDSPGRWAEAHQDDSTDADKDQALRDVGWEVIRIRTGGLAATSCWDVIASGPTRKSALEVIAMYNLVLAGARTDFPLYASCGPDERGRVGRSLQARLP